MNSPCAADPFPTTSHSSEVACVDSLPETNTDEPRAAEAMDVFQDKVLHLCTPKASSRVHRLRKVISINGEEVSAASIQDINIHDFTVFEREQYITRKFMSTIRRKEGRGTRSISEILGSEIEKKSSFKDIARNVIRADNVLRAMQHYHHRSDSETETDGDDDDDEDCLREQAATCSLPSPETSSCSLSGIMGDHDCEVKARCESNSAAHCNNKNNNHCLTPLSQQDAAEGLSPDPPDPAQDRADDLQQQRRMSALSRVSFGCCMVL